MNVPSLRKQSIQQTDIKENGQFQPYWSGIPISNNNFLYIPNNTIEFIKTVKALKTHILKLNITNQLEEVNFTKFDNFIPQIGINGMFDAFEQGMYVY